MSEWMHKTHFFLPPTRLQAVIAIKTFSVLLPNHFLKVYCHIFLVIPQLHHHLHSLNKTTPHLILNSYYLPCYSLLNSAWSFCSSCAPPAFSSNTSLSLAPGLSVILQVLFFFVKHSFLNIHFEFVSLEHWCYNSTQTEVISNLDFFLEIPFFFFLICLCFFMSNICLGITTPKLPYFTHLYQIAHSIPTPKAQPVSKFLKSW